MRIKRPHAAIQFFIYDSFYRYNFVTQQNIC